MTQSATQLRGMPANYIFPADDEKPWIPSIEGSGGNPTLTYTERRGAYSYLGQYLFLRFHTLTGTWTGAGGGAVQFSPPDVPELTNILQSAASGVVGGGVWYDASAASSIILAPTMSTAGKIQFTKQGGVTFTCADCGSNDQIGFWLLIPIKGRSGRVPLLNVKTTSPILAGMIMAWPSVNAVPDGWGEADGGALNIADFPDLYAQYGTTYNTQINPTTGAAWAAPAAGQFRKPDYRGLFLRGAGSPSAGTALGVGDYQNDQFQGHYHLNSVRSGGNIGTSANYTASDLLPPQASSGTLADSTNPANANYVRGPWQDQSGNGTPRVGSETRPKNKGVRWICKLYNESFYPLSAPIADGNTSGFISNGAQNIGGDKTFAGKISASNLLSGRFTPALAVDANSAVPAVPYSVLYSRNNNIVSVSGKFDINLSAASGTPTIVRMTLPIASAFANANDLNGSGSCNATTGGAYMGVVVTGYLPDNQARFDFLASQAGVRTVCFNFQYEVK